MKIFILSLLITAGVQDSSSLNPQQELETIQALLLDVTNIDSIVEKALANSYTLQLDEARVKQQQYSIKQERNSWSRSFRFGVNFFNISTVPSANDGNVSVTQASVLSNIGLTLGVNPEDFINRKSRIRVAEQELEVRKLDLHRDRRDIESFVIGKFLEYQQALEVFIIRENNLMISEENKLVADEQFRQGRISTLEYNKLLGDLMLKQEALVRAETIVMKLKKEIELIISA